MDGLSKLFPLRSPHNTHNLPNSYKDSCRAVLALLGFAGINQFSARAGVYPSEMYRALYNNPKLPRIERGLFLRIVEAFKSTFAVRKPMLNQAERNMIAHWLYNWASFCARERLQLGRDHMAVVNPTRKRQLQVRARRIQKKADEVATILNDLKPKRKRKKTSGRAGGAEKDKEGSNGQAEQAAVQS